MTAKIQLLLTSVGRGFDIHQTYPELNPGTFGSMILVI